MCHVCVLYVCVCAQACGMLVSVHVVCVLGERTGGCVCVWCLCECVSGVFVRVVVCVHVCECG